MLIWWITTAAIASVEPGDRWIGNSNLNVGLHQDGSFVNNDLDLGILWDPDGPDGPIPMTGDMVRVGYHWDGWAWSYWGEDGPEAGFQAGPHNDSWSAMTWVDKTVNSALSMLTSTIEFGDLNLVLHSIALQRTDVIIQDYTFTTTQTVSLLSLGRTIDADQDEWLLDSRVTDNLSGEGWASSSSQYDDRTVAIAGQVLGGEYGEGGVCNWCDSTDSMLESSWESSTGDNQINVVVDAGTLHPDESITVRFVYAFEVGAMDAQEAAMAALEFTDIDNDGLSKEEGDCNDFDPDTFPGATELADDADNDCDGVIDEDTLGEDDDGDGFSEADGDCDDDDSDVYPGAEPSDGVSNADCDGVADDTEGIDSEDTGSSPEDETTDDTGAAPEDGTTDDTGPTPEDELADDTGPTPEDDPDPEDEADSEGDEPDSEDDNESDTPEDSSSNGFSAEGEQHKSCSHTSPMTSGWMWLAGILAWTRRQTHLSRGEQ